ncbi:MAG: hypothetical protein RL660_659 [Bacteroidota bacterium]|jgi:GLPGLI family protein
MANLMTRKVIFTCCAVLLLSNTQLCAQQIINSGTILFERKVNMHKMMESYNQNEDQGWITRYKKENPKYAIVNFDLAFNDSISVYRKSKTQPPKDPNERGGFFFRGNDDEEYVMHKNLNTGKLVASKQVFEMLALVQDSIPKVEWKLTNEFKQFAGYNCRKATTMMFDTVFVIAYYTDAIACSSGPQSFAGLPGMVLCVHVPRTFTTYIAKEVNTTAVLPADLIPPSKGTKHTYRSLTKAVSEAANEWNKRWLSRTLWNMLM